MKKFILGVCASAVSICSFAQQHKVHVEITGLRNSKGKVLLSVYNSERGFPDKIELAMLKDQAAVKNNSVEFNYDLKKGDYAIAVLHDENGNMKMDTKTFGLPKEGYGFSNNVMGLMGPPSFKKAAIHVTTNTNISIRMKY